MATYFIDPSAASNGTGSSASPFNTWIGVPVAAGHVYKQKRGTTWTGAFPSLTSGTSGNVTTIAAYANTDGSDNAALAWPVIDNGDAMFPGTLGSPKTFMKWQSVNLKNLRSAVATDTPIMWLGNDVEFDDVGFDTNLTALYGENKSRIKIRNCRIKACTASSTSAAMNAFVIAGSVTMTGIDIDGLDILIGDGGPSNAHAVKIGGTTAMTDLIVKNVKVRTISGLPTTHVNKAGVFVSNVKGAELLGSSGTAAATMEISGIDVSNLVDGVFTSSVSGAWIHHCKLNDNNSFGLHMTGNSANPSAGCIIEWNQCNRNGRNVSPWYGRGIELSGGGQLHGCTGHIVRFNDCSYNYNWGGPGDNGTEGVGIGLDDATSFTFVYGSRCEGNEGQGVQFYGGYVPPADTGGNLVTGNWLINNGAAAIWNRRTGGSFKTGGSCNISLANTFGSKTVIAYNLIVGGDGGLRESSECANVEKYGNVFMEQAQYAQALNLTYSRPDDFGTYYDSAGVLKTAPRLSARSTYDPANLAAAPTAMIEAAATNHIRNNTMRGAVAGPPGALPTHWTVGGSASGAISREVVGTGVEQGIEYVDIRFFGVVPAGGNPEAYIAFDTTGATATNKGESWAASLYVRVAAGSTFGVSGGEIYILGYSSGGSLTESAPKSFTYSTGPLGINRLTHTRTMLLESTQRAQARLDLNFTPDNPTVNVTLRIGLPQLERNQVTSPIRTDGVAITRGADTPITHDNIYTPGIPKNIASLALDANNSPAPALVSAGVLGDATTSPMLDAAYRPLAGSPLLSRSVPWAPAPKIA